jgi:hypothetical protein
VSAAAAVAAQTASTLLVEELFGSEQRPRLATGVRLRSCCLTRGSRFLHGEVMLLQQKVMPHEAAAAILSRKRE